jgi:RNA polymerase sigma factor (TIGR02999 family)
MPVRRLIQNLNKKPVRNMDDPTQLLAAAGNGDKIAAEELLNLLYEELRRLAASKMAQQGPGQTLQPTALVHEAWLRLMGANYSQFTNRAHFFSAAAEAMRCILIDRARRRQTRRHGGNLERVPIDGVEIAAPEEDDELLAVHESLDRLKQIHPEHAEIVKLRYFVGMTNEETAEALDVSVATVKNYWTFARTWIFHDLKRA